ncbi:uncharacterized protein METZ01_LOCUS133548 [marine metagenome]|uniref:Heparan-alpha-glucosaminide N-acetyltransferase catalytic domain-containing protein n=1 Tax=marine metagenome TaxID=408172 RepID=A0A381YUQ5_9ZZZZ
MTKPRRIYSIDIFRGMTIAIMILVNNPGSWGHVYAPFLHAKWHGCTLTDLVFPFFLFIVGVAMRFSFVKWHYFASRKFYKHIFWRSFSIFMAGWFIHAYPFIQQDWDWSSFRYMGVLQRIAIAYGISALFIIKYDFKKLMQIIAGILILYWGLLWIGGSGNPYDLETNLPRKLDIWLFGEKHLYNGFGIPFDPEGLLSTLPSIGTVLIGYLMGGMLHTTKNYTDCTKRMAVFGVGLVLIGWFWGFIFPINKALWTSSYVLFTGGIGAMILAGLTYLINIRLWKRPFWFFEVFGTNSLFIFVGSGIWTKTILKIKFTLDEQLISGYGYFYKSIFQPFAGDLNGSLLFALTHVIGWWLILYWMYRKKIFIKL